tara:strand:- start:7463 stop:8992 length:1530 start_codon:yes stop_codon:yes gene_type:complete
MPLWTPDDLGTGILTAWYKADSIKQDDGSAVATWDDSSGNSNTTSQSATARQPSFEKNELHGRPVVRFDGTNDILTDGDIAALDVGTGDIWMACVFKSTDDSAVQNIFEKGATKFGLRVLANGNLQMIMGSTTFSAVQNSGNWSRTEFVMITAARVSNTNNGFVNGSASDSTGLTDNGSISNSDVFDIGARAVGAGAMTGDIAEVLVGGATLSTSDRQRLEGYLAHKWGMTANLPSDHPYRLVPPTVSIPTITWIGDGNPADITDPDNWSDGLGPTASKRCIIADKSDSITFGNLICKELSVLEGFTGNIGTTSSALNVTADNVTIKAPLAQTYLDLDVDSAFLENAGLGCKLEGDITTLHYSSPTKATLEMDTLVTANVEGAGRVATLHLDKGVVTNVGPNGSVKINGDVTTVNVSGGKVFCGDHVVNTFNINGGHVAYGGDTLTTLNIYAGEFDLGGNENTQVNITNLNLYGGFVDLQNAISAAEVTSLKTFGDGRIRLPLGTTTVS